MLFFLFYFVIGPVIYSIDNPLVYTLVYVIILLIPAIASLYLVVRWASYRRHSRRMREEYEAEIKAHGIPGGKSCDKNLCNVCLNLVPDSAQKCPFCGAEMEVKKRTIEAPAERVSARQAIRRLGDNMYHGLVSSFSLIPLVIILILAIGLILSFVFGMIADLAPFSPTQFAGIRMQSVLIWGSFITGCICVLCSTFLPSGAFMSFPNMWRFTVPAGRKESANNLEVIRARWLVMAGFCLLIFVIGLLLPF